MFQSRCENCKSEYRWTRKACPRCWRPNENTPAVVGCKLLCVVLICAAVWLTAHLLMTAGDGSAGVVKPMPEKDRPRIRQYYIAPEEPVRDPVPGSRR